ncbi:MAG: ABC transporter permease [Bacilli bacterium]|nr:ABC transporter permease [Bacilli bacterium]
MSNEMKNKDELLEEKVQTETPKDQSAKVEKDEFEETYKQMSPFKLILRRFFRSKLSVVGLCIIVFLFLFAFLGPVVYNKWDETEVDRTQVAKIYTEEKTIINEYGEEITIIQEIEIFDDNLKAYPSKDHLLGTDEKGMDIFVRLMYGGRISLTIGFIVVILETILGVLLGGISGYFGGKVDQVIMRIVDVFNCIPMLPILLIASAVLDAFSIAEIIDNSDRIYFLMLIITVFGWSGCARMVRGQILSLREQEFIVATEVMGIPTWRRIFVHLIPNVMPQLIVNMTLGLGSIILYESTLSYLGLGVQIPYAAWGTMISSSKNPEILSNYMNMWLPAGILIVLAVLGFNFVGDGLRDAMDPKSKK